ncbi:MAG: hypothetical protein LCH96_06740 [Actinobacteria bacterium]|nr:hypothetical protein [Actinomycetota bacterium]
MDEEQEYLLRRMLEAYLPAPAPREPGDHARPAMPAVTTASTPWELRESLDAYERVFFSEGATPDHVRAVAAPWRATGLTPAEVQQWLDAGVYPDEPDLAAALAAADFTPQEARRTTIRYRSDSEQLNVISAVRGRTEQAEWAAELKHRLRVVNSDLRSITG